MKKIIALILTALFAVVMFSSCGGVKGKYILQSIEGKSLKETLKEEYGSVEDALDELGVKSINDAAYIELKSGGKAVIVYGPTTTKGTWEKDGKTIIIAVKGGNEVELKLKGNKLILEDDDGKELEVFKKK